ncbi:MAG: ATP-binding protein [Micromonosporaceae bacterium]|nr:ATP-binding protein [Micromonosporaceae bacterium]
MNFPQQNSDLYGRRGGNRCRAAYHRGGPPVRQEGHLGGRRATREAEGSVAVTWSRRSLRTAARLSADTLNALRVGVVVLDPADQPVLANPTAVDLGLVRTSDTARQVHPVLRTLAGQVRRTGVRREVELELPRSAAGDASRAEPWGVRVTVTALTGDAYPSGHVAIEATDVTEAHRVARVRRDFVANVSHELKTPVGALALLAETLLDAVDDPEASRRFAERIHHESQRLARLVKELLELSRLQGADPLPEPVPVPVDRIIAEVIDRARTGATAKGIDLVVTGAHGLTVYGNEGQLVTAVANLVENAITYSPEDTKVTVDAAVVGDQVHIAVIDQGIGIAAKDLDRIFERFYRADQARSRDTGGTGLGLAIVRHIAVNHGGRVTVESTVGVGSTFTLRLPARAPDAALPLPPGGEIDPMEIDLAGTDQ